MEISSSSSYDTMRLTTNISGGMFSKVSMLIFALSPILAWYDIHFPVGLGYMLILFLSAFLIVRNKFKVFVLPKVFWLLFSYVCFMWAYNNQFGFWTLFPPGGWLFFMFVLAVIGGTISFNMNLLKKYMRIVLLIAIVLFWIQFIMMQTTGSHQYCFVPNLTGQFTYEGFSYADLVAHQLEGTRPCSIFLEPSYMAYYCITYLVLEWFGSQFKQKLFTKDVILILVTLIALRSGSGIVGVAILFSAKMLSMLWNANTGRRITMLVFMIPLIVASFYVYLNTDAGEAMFSRSSELSTENTSGYARVVAGYLKFESLSPNDKIIGIPNPREVFGLERSDGRTVFYINGVQTILISLGYIGAFVYLLFYVSLFRKVSLQSRMSIIMLLTMGLLESNYLNAYMMLFTIIPCGEYYLHYIRQGLSK